MRLGRCLGQAERSRTFMRCDHTNYRSLALQLLGRFEHQTLLFLSQHSPSIELSSSISYVIYKYITVRFSIVI